jgi:hypothetical protein
VLTILVMEVNNYPHLGPWLIPTIIAEGAAVLASLNFASSGRRPWKEVLTTYQGGKGQSYQYSNQYSAQYSHGENASLSYEKRRSSFSQAYNGQSSPAIAAAAATTTTSALHTAAAATTAPSGVVLERASSVAGTDGPTPRSETPADPTGETSAV